MLLHVIELVFFAGFALSAAYTAFAIVCVLRWRAGLPRTAMNRPAAATPQRIPVTIAKPLCGDEPNLHENLRSFCDQEYPEYQVVFGVDREDDPAADVVRKLMAEIPDRDLQLVIAPSSRADGRNRKVVNLAAMQPSMKHDIIAVSDSDMHAGADYLDSVVAPFSNPAVGAVTCLYSGVPAATNPASILGAMQINESFLPSVLVARELQPLRYCFGATMAIRRRELEAIGGFAALESQLADDYMLGKLVSDRGSEVALAHTVVENIVFEPSIRDLFRHEVRWARTIRSMRPASYAGTILTMPLLWSLAFAFSTRDSGGVAAVAVAVALRLGLQAASRSTLRVSVPYAPWLIPLRDILTALVFITSHFGRSVRWKTSILTVARGGELSIAAAPDAAGERGTAHGD